ncbi:MAG TPA: YraN family protein [Enhygromyxa sp.]|nr:YraN family protein [Enhygromyxa sp.]
MSGDESTRVRGQHGEQQAADHLLRRGLEILARNVTAAGAELDLIARDGETIVFVEVRKRSDDRLGHPLETINAHKQSRIRRGATGWLIQQGLWERTPVRFDVVAIVGDDVEAIEWLRDAF